MTFMVRNKTVSVLLACMFILPLGCREKGEAPPLNRVERKDIYQRVTLTGTVTPNRRTVIMPSFSGYVTKLFVDVGSPVKAGDPVVTISQSLARKGDESFPLRAPFPGKVVQVLVSEGQYVDPKDQSKLVRIDDLSRLYVRANVPEVEVDRVRPGQTAMIRTASQNSKEFHGIVKNIALAAAEKREGESGSAEFPVLIEIDDAGPDGPKPGISVLIDIMIAAAKDTLVVRQENVLRVQNGYAVVGEDGKRKAIRVGIQNDDYVQILEGATEGERLRRVDLDLTNAL